MTAFTFRDLAFVSGRRLLYPAYVQDYLDRVTAADVAAGNTQGLELGVTDAFSTCLQSLVADGILGVSGNVLAQAASLIKASCFMQGARTLSGALVPLAADMPAPTNFNFVVGDYNRRTGLIGNGSTKWLNSNRNNNQDPQNNKHLSVYVTTLSSMDSPYMGAVDGAGTSILYRRSIGASGMHGVKVSSLAITGTNNAGLGLFGASRASSSSISFRSAAVSGTDSVASEIPLNGDIAIFRLGTTGAYGTGQIAFYSVGESLGLAILDARITALSNAIQAAIAP